MTDEEKLEEVVRKLDGGHSLYCCCDDCSPDGFWDEEDEWDMEDNEH